MVSGILLNRSGIDLGDEGTAELGNTVSVALEAIGALLALFGRLKATQAIGLLAALMFLPSCGTTLGKFQGATNAIQERYDVQIGVVPVLDGKGIAMAGPFIVRPLPPKVEAPDDAPEDGG